MIAAAYVSAALIGFRLAFVAEQITTVWAPTGIAMAALLVCGDRLWPAIWIGALIANTASSAPLWTAVILATGNTLEAVAAVWLLRLLRPSGISFDRVADVLAFVLVAAVACTTISATIGVAALCAAGVQPWARFGMLWFDWWLGDALGAAVVAPTIVTVVRRRWSSGDFARAAAYVAAATTVTQLIFGQVLGARGHPLEYLVFPIVIVAAVAHGPAMTCLSVLSVAAVSIWHTAHGAGPFGGPQVHQSLVLLQAFMGVLAVTALLLAAAVAERQSTQRREKDAAAEVERVLAARIDAEAALRDSRDVLSLAMRGGSMGAWSRSFITNDVWWSRELEEIVGLEPGAFNRTEAGFFEFVHEDDRVAVRDAVDHAVNGASDYIVEFRFRHGGGEWRWMEGRGRALYFEDGTPRTLYGIGIDITERKQAEMALRNAKAAAESANQLKDQFLATLSHELRTPLNAILGYARMLQTNVIAPEKRQHAIDVIERNAVAQHQLVEELLDMSRITTGKLRLDPAPVPVIDVLVEAIEGIRPAAEAKGITLNVQLDRSAGTVSADSTRLQQIFWNILTNAVKFTRHAGRIDVSLSRLPAECEVRVTDTGVGIPAEFMPHMFEPFRQADARADRGHGGLGLGLAISRQLVELHGGTIYAFSEGAGRGSTFTVRLPRVSAGRPEAAARSPRRV